jgi:PKD repeat protein
MRVSSRSLVSPAMTIGLISAVVAIGIILFAANVTIINAQQLTNQPAVTQNGTRLFEGTEDSFRLQVPEGWIIHDANNTGSMLVEESTQGYGILAQLCPQEEEEQQEQVGAAALVSNVSGVDTGRCQGSEGNIIHIVRYPDLDTRLQVPNNITTTTTTNNNNNNSITIDNILLYHMQKLEEVGYRDIRIVNSTDTTINVIGTGLNNNVIATVPAKTVEMKYRTAASAPNEIREGYFILTATNATHPNVGMTKGYSIFYEGTSSAAGAATAATIQGTTTMPSGSLPRPPPAAVRQVFDSFELIADQEVTQDMLAAQAQEVEEPTNPLTVNIVSSDTEGGEAAAPATIEFEADITGGIEPYTISWNFDDGSSDDVAVDHTFEEAGSYNVGLTVTDSGGQSASDSMEITVEEAPAADEVEDEVVEEVVEEVEEEAAPPAADEVEDEVEEEQTIIPPADETITIEEQAEEEEVEVEEVEPDLDDVDNNLGSDDLFDVDDFIDDLFDRLGIR